MNSSIIFICTFEPIGKGLPIYTVRNQVIEDKTAKYDDGATKIFINVSKHCRPELNVSLKRACEIIGLSVEEYNNIKENIN